MPDVSMKELLRALPDEVAPDPAFAARLRRELETELTSPRTTAALHWSPSQPTTEMVEMKMTRKPFPERRATPWWPFASAAAAVVVLAGILVVTSGDDGVRVETSPDPRPTPIEEDVDTVPPVSEVRTEPTEVVDDSEVDVPVDPTFVDGQSTTIDIAIGENPYRIAVAGGQLWVMSLAGDLARFDATTLEQTAVLEVSESSAMAATADALWIADTLTGEVVRIDPESATVITSIPTDIRLEDDIYRPTGAGMLLGATRRFALIGGIDATAQAVWVGDHDGRVLKIDPLTDAVVQRLEVGMRPDIVHVDGSHLIVGDYDTDTVVVYDTDSGEEIARFAPVDRLIGAALHGNAAYVHDAATGVVHRIDLTTGQLTSSEPLGATAELTGLPIFSPGPIVGVGGVLVEANDEFVVLDPVDLQVDGRFDIGGSGGEMTLDDVGDAWVVRYTRSTVTRLETVDGGS